MSDPILMRHRVARGGALVCSLALGVFVIVNAQLGCDAPASDGPPPAEPAAKLEPAAKVEPAAKLEPAAKAPEANTDAPEPKVEPAANPDEPPPPELVGTPNNKKKLEPVYMPASKSGGDFGAMQFPGQGTLNPAPNAAPTQQQAAQE
jgi:hypothetical protein